MTYALLIDMEDVVNEVCSLLVFGCAKHPVLYTLLFVIGMAMIGFVIYYWLKPKEDTK